MERQCRGQSLSALSLAASFLACLVAVENLLQSQVVDTMKETKTTVIFALSTKLPYSFKEFNGVYYSYIWLKLESPWEQGFRHTWEGLPRLG